MSKSSPLQTNIVLFKLNGVTDYLVCLCTQLKCCGVEGDVKSKYSWVYYSRETHWFRNRGKLSAVTRQTRRLSGLSLV